MIHIADSLGTRMRAQKSNSWDFFSRLNIRFSDLALELTIMTENQPQEFLSKALAARSALLASNETNALRLFAGFYEGFPGLAVDLYGQTLVLFDHRENADPLDDWMDHIQAFYLDRLPQIRCVLRKGRSSHIPGYREGVVTHGSQADDSINEHGVRYAIRLQMNQDASFYLDTRALRGWLRSHSAGMSVLNTFAYTGSLGVACLAGGAARVIQNDRNRNFLELARTSCMLNRLDLGRMKLRAVDFFSEVARLKQEGGLFDLVLLDPPFFSVTEKGTVNQVGAAERLINKVRPLVKDGGRIVAVNNSLFVSGEEYLGKLEALCTDGYLEIEERIPVPMDVTGFPGTVVAAPPVSPQPFNHPTKIVVLKVRRK